MDFGLDSEQSILRDSVERYWRARPGGPDSRWSDFAQLGWLGIAVPQESGDLSGSLLNTAILMEEFGRHHATEPFVPCAVVAGRLVHEAGGGACGTLLQDIVGGAVRVAVAASLTESGTDCRFEAAADPRAPCSRYVLRGVRTVVTTAAAQKVIVPAMTAEGPTLFAVNCVAEGVTRRAVRGIDGSDAAEMRIDGARVAESAIVGRMGAAAEPLRAALDHGTIALCAESVGAMTGVLGSTRDHLRQRRQYGASLSSYQALQHRLADMFASVELSRSMLYAALAALMSRDPGERRRTLLCAGSYIGSRGREVGEAAVQLHGATGMTADSEVGRYFRRLVAISCAMTAGYHHECHAEQ